MRYALNNLQATASGFDKIITRENVFRVCDQPHPEIIQNCIRYAIRGQFSHSCAEVDKVFSQGYNLVDIVHSLTREVQNSQEIRDDIMRLNFLKEASVVKMRTLEGNTSQLQLHGFISKLCTIALDSQSQGGQR